MTSVLAQRSLGPLQVSAIGLGAMPLSRAGHDVPENQALATVHAALDAGVTVIDTADAYTPSAADVGHNERLVARALASWGSDTSHVVVATKGGHIRTSDGGWDVDGRPEHIRRACDASLRALGVEALGLYQHHRPDPAVPYEETLGAFRELHEAGKVRMVGISNADPEQIRSASRVLGEALVSVQNQLSPAFRTSEPELRVCEELGLAFLPWSPLGGMSKAADLGARYAVFADVAAAHGVSPQQICLAWLLAKSPAMIPIPGASRPQSITSSADAVRLELAAEERERLDAAR